MTQISSWRTQVFQAHSVSIARIETNVLARLVADYDAEFILEDDLTISNDLASWDGYLV